MTPTPSWAFPDTAATTSNFTSSRSSTNELSDEVKARVGAIEPKRSTRMGAAIRHIREKFKDVASRSRHAILLSDGFPQDFDYGHDRRSNAYGIQDTMVALKELELAGVLPFLSPSIAPATTICGKCARPPDIW